MAYETSLIDELKIMFGTLKLHECFKLLTVQEKHDDESFIQYLGERSNELESRIQAREERMVEVLLLNHDEEEAAGDTYENLHTVQVRERRRLEALTGFLIELRAGIKEKDDHISIYEFYDDID